MRSTSLALEVFVDRKKHGDHDDHTEDEDDRIAHLPFLASRLPSERIAGTQRPM